MTLTLCVVGQHFYPIHAQESAASPPHSAKGVVADIAKLPRLAVATAGIANSIIRTRDPQDRESRVNRTYVQNYTSSLAVSADGFLYTDTTWEEGHRPAGTYHEGDALADHPEFGAGTGDAVAVSDHLVAYGQKGSIVLFSRVPGQAFDGKGGAASRREITITPSIGKARISALAIDEKGGRLWFATAEDGAVRCVGMDGKLVATLGANVPNAGALALDHTGAVWVTQREQPEKLMPVTGAVFSSDAAAGHAAEFDFHMRANGNPPLEPVPNTLDYEIWTGPAPLRPYDGSPHKRWWRTFTEYGNGIVGDMCVHMFDTVSWMLNLGWPNRVSSAGGIFVQKDGKSNISDTQSAVFEYDQFNCNWQHRTWGEPTDTDYPWALFIHGEKGVLKASTMRADFIPSDKKAKPLHFDCHYEREQYPEDVTEKEIELNAAPATRRHMLDFLAAVEKRSFPIADIEQGHISTASCLLANMAMDLGRPVVYDPKKRVVVNDGETTKRLTRAYRKPWKHPAA